MMIRSQTLLATLAMFFAFMIAGNAQDGPTKGEDFVRAPAIEEGLSVSNAFQSNMVLQRDKPLTIWGWASVGEKISVKFGTLSAEATTNKNRSWHVMLDSIPANSTPGLLKIQGKEKTIELKNILVGDVWVLGGQSNMEFDLSKVDDGMLEIVSANFPQIRLLTLPRGKGFESVKSFERLDEWSDWSNRHFAKGDWEVCSPESIPEISALGYVFCRRV
jgi:sialate O-acetylesterase